MIASDRTKRIVDVLIPTGRVPHEVRERLAASTLVLIPGDTRLRGGATTRAAEAMLRGELLGRLKARRYPALSDSRKAAIPSGSAMSYLFSFGRPRPSRSARSASTISARPVFSALQACRASLSTLLFTLPVASHRGGSGGTVRRTG